MVQCSTEHYVIDPVGRHVGSIVILPQVCVHYINDILILAATRVAFFLEARTNNVIQRYGLFQGTHFV